MSSEKTSKALEVFTRQEANQVTNVIRLVDTKKEILHNIGNTLRNGMRLLSGEKQSRVGVQGSINIKQKAKDQWRWCVEHGKNHRKKDWAKFHPAQGEKVLPMTAAKKKAA